MNELIDAINEYLDVVERGMQLVEAKWGRRDILTAWHQRVVPPMGDLLGGITYELHGIGCCFVFEDFEVDFDFGPNGRSDGFDLWRLRHYIRQFPSRFQSLKKDGTLEAAFEALKSEGIVVQEFPTESQLFFLRANRSDE
jgi:hypothetical protein